MKILSVVLVTIMIFTLVSCGENKEVTSSLPHESDNASDFSEISPSADEVISEIYSDQEYNEILRVIDSVEFPWNPMLSGAQYDLTSQSVRELSSIEIKGLPLLITKIFEYETLWKDEYFMYETAQGAVLAEDYALTTHCMLRIDYPLFLKLSNQSELHNTAWTEAFYKTWNKIKAELTKISQADMTVEEKLSEYRKMGIFAVPYVEKEIENGCAELEEFFVLIGAHLTTKEYLLLVKRDNYAQPLISLEEYDAALTASAEGFDYKVWLSENEEDLNNLFAYLDAYCAEYEAENK